MARFFHFISRRFAALTQANAWYRGVVAQLFLAVWLAAFAVQTMDVLALVAPDSCTQDAQGSAGDPCPDKCSRCVCCARMPAFISQHLPTSLEPAVPPMLLPRPDPSTTPTPRDVFHVPKNS